MRAEMSGVELVSTSRHSWYVYTEHCVLSVACLVVSKDSARANNQTGLPNFSNRHGDMASERLDPSQREAFLENGFVSA